MSTPLSPPPPPLPSHVDGGDSLASPLRGVSSVLDEFDAEYRRFGPARIGRLPSPPSSLSLVPSSSSSIVGAVPATLSTTATTTIDCLSLTSLTYATSSTPTFTSHQRQHESQFRDQQQHERHADVLSHQRSQQDQQEQLQSQQQQQKQQQALSSHDACLTQRPIDSYHYHHQQLQHHQLQSISRHQQASPTPSSPPSLPALPAPPALGRPHGGGVGGSSFLACSSCFDGGGVDSPLTVLACSHTVCSKCMFVDPLSNVVRCPHCGAAHSSVHATMIRLVAAAAAATTATSRGGDRGSSVNVVGGVSGCCDGVSGAGVIGDRATEDTNRPPVADSVLVAMRNGSGYTAANGRCMFDAVGGSPGYVADVTVSSGVVTAAAAVNGRHALVGHSNARASNCRVDSLQLHVFSDDVAGDNSIGSNNNNNNSSGNKNFSNSSKNKFQLGTSCGGAGPSSDTNGSSDDQRTVCGMRREVSGDLTQRGGIASSGETGPPSSRAGSSPRDQRAADFSVGGGVCGGGATAYDGNVSRNCRRRTAGDSGRRSTAGRRVNASGSGAGARNESARQDSIVPGSGARSDSVTDTGGDNLIGGARNNGGSGVSSSCSNSSGSGSNGGSSSTANAVRGRGVGGGNEGGNNANFRFEDAVISSIPSKGPATSVCVDIAARLRRLSSDHDAPPSQSHRSPSSLTPLTSATGDLSAASCMFESSLPLQPSPPLPLRRDAAASHAAAAVANVACPTSASLLAATTNPTASTSAATTTTADLLQLAVSSSRLLSSASPSSSPALAPPPPPPLPAFPVAQRFAAGSGGGGGGGSGSNQCSTTLPLCSSCDERNPARGRCRDCSDELLCDHCINAHRRVRLTRGHTIIVFGSPSLSMSPQLPPLPLLAHSHSQSTSASRLASTGVATSSLSSATASTASATATAVNDNMQLYRGRPLLKLQCLRSEGPKTPERHQQLLAAGGGGGGGGATRSCAEHNESLYIYCDSCDELICGQCAQLVHREHSVQYVREAAAAGRSLLARSLRDTEARVKILREGLANNAAMAKRVEQRTHDVASQIRAAIRRQLSSLEDREKELLSKVECIRLLKGKLLRLQQEQIEHATAQLTRQARALRDLLASAAELDFVRAARLLPAECGGGSGDALQSVNSMPFEDDRIDFTIADIPLLNNLGFISTTSFPMHCKIYGEALKGAVVGQMTTFKVEAYNHLSEKTLVGGEHFVATISGPSGGPLRIDGLDHRDGTYSFGFRPNVEGCHRMTVTLRGAMVAASPYDIHVRIGRSYENLPNERPVVIFGGEGKQEGQLYRPWGVCVEPHVGRIIVADRSNNRIQVFNSDGTFYLSFGGYGSCPGQFDRPAGVTTDSSGRIIVADKDNHRIQIFTGSGEFLSTFGERGYKPGQFSYPWDVAVNSEGRIAVSDSRNHRVQLFSRDGALINKYGFDGPLWKQFDSPRGVAFDSQDNLVVTDFNNHRLVVVRSDFRSAQFLGFEGAGSGEFVRPQGVAVDCEGRIVVADSRNHRVQVFLADGTFLCAFGGGPGSQPGQMDRPSGIAVAPDGRLVIVDFGNHRVQVY